MDDLRIRNSHPEDRGAIEGLYAQAFPEEDLLSLLGDLLSESSNCVSLVGILRSRVIGHIVFTPCEIAGDQVAASLLGPLAVTPDCQRQGAGTALVQAGLGRMKESEASVVCVLGDPAYYGRLGFEPEILISPPYPLPDEWRGAWQSRVLRRHLARPAGRLRVPEAWMRRELWSD